MDASQSRELREWNRIYKEMNEIYHELAQRQGLSDSAFDILYVMLEFGDGCLQKDICDRTFTSKQTINSSIRKLERAGLLRLEPGRGRDMHLHLTEAGRRLADEKVVPVIAAENSAFFGMAPAERRELLRLAGAYLEQFRQSAKKI